MKRVETINCFFLYERKLVEVQGYVENNKVLFLRHVKDEDKPKCPNCGEILHEHDQFNVVEGSLNFQGGAEKIDTLVGDD